MAQNGGGSWADDVEREEQDEQQQQQQQPGQAPDEDDDDGPPPGFEGSAPLTVSPAAAAAAPGPGSGAPPALPAAAAVPAAAAAAAPQDGATEEVQQRLAGVKVSEAPAVDEPDLSLKAGGLVGEAPAVDEPDLSLKTGGLVGEAPAVDEPDLSLKAGGLVEPEDHSAIKTVTAGNTLYTSAASFEELGLSAELLQGLYSEMKFERPSKVQAQTLPMILTPPHRNLIAQAHNGSGKTTCFVLAMLSRVDVQLKAPQALCVCPTRELVLQNLAVLERMGKFSGITSTSTAAADYGASRRARIEDQVIIGTHGKLKDWVSKRLLNLRTIKILVFDEADEMLKLPGDPGSMARWHTMVDESHAYAELWRGKQDGFADDTVRLVKQLRLANPEVQILLFSATYNERIKRFAQKVVPDANQVFVPKEELSLDVIKQYRVYCPAPGDKVRVLKDMIFPQCEKLGQTIIFVRTRETARGLHSALEREGHKCTSIEGGMLKEQRDRVVKEFREGTTKILISTDVLSRGFDVTQVTLVINFDVPVERDLRTPAFETYLHRIGRSGRFGRKGAAFNLVTGTTEKKVIDEIEAYFKHDIPEVALEDEDRFIAVLKKAGLTDG
ncbi:hypothetical protein N2152v2_002782 [Parachlorella kessleri]